MKQTAVEWLIEQIKKEHPFWTSIFEQAKEMEKQQIIDGFKEGTKMFDVNDELSAGFNGVIYFYETYGSNDHIVDTNEMVEKSDKPFLIHGEHQIQMLEISDAEIAISANQYCEKNATFFEIQIEKNNAFIYGARWYREQLKKK